jgi:hypothetical protein
MKISYTDIIEISWQHLSPRNAEIMARWEMGESYTEIAKCVRENITRGCVASVVAKNRDDGHVAVPRGPNSSKRQPAGGGDGHRYCETPIRAFRQPEVDQLIASRARLKGALK